MTGTDAALDGVGAAEDGTGAGEDAGGADDTSGADDGGAGEDAGGAADEGGGAAEDGAGAEDAGAAELTGTADETSGAAEEGVLGAAEDATEGVDGSGAADDAGADDGAADGVTGWDEAATEGEAGEEEAANGWVGADEGERRELNVLAASELTDDMVVVARHAGGQAEKYKVAERQSQSTQCNWDEDVSVSRMPAVQVSWFVPVFPMHARRVMRGSTVAVRAATGGGTTRVMMYGSGRARKIRENRGGVPWEVSGGERAKEEVLQRRVERRGRRMGDLSSVDLKG